MEPRDTSSGFGQWLAGALNALPGDARPRYLGTTNGRNCSAVGSIEDLLRSLGMLHEFADTEFMYRGRPG